MHVDDLKKAAGNAAISFVENNMTVGLGTGSTAAHFIDALGEKARNGLSVSCIPTSEQTKEHAMRVGLDIIEPDEATSIDIAIDGADELDGGLQLIKGGGGALLREKIIAKAAKKFVVIADASKKVAQLGAFPLPVEIDPALWALTARAVKNALASLDYNTAAIDLRGGGPNGVSLTDGDHFVLDCALGRITDAATLDAALQEIPGVIETGLFLKIADVAIVADEAGVQTLTRS